MLFGWCIIYFAIKFKYKKLYKNKYDILIENGNYGSVNNACAAATIAKTLNIPDAVIISSLQKMIKAFERNKKLIWTEE
jgi:UDP-N-acetylmuramyl pentapeptide synthase